MTTLTQDFTGNGEFDLEQQLWAWRSANPQAVAVARQPIEHLELVMKAPVPGATLVAPDTVRLRIEYRLKELPG
jgi:hypothetical protein